VVTQPGESMTAIVKFDDIINYSQTGYLDRLIAFQLFAEFFITLRIPCPPATGGDIEV
jgi:hypothetical protein